MSNRNEQGVDLSLRQFIKTLGGVAGGAVLLSSVPWLSSCTPEKLQEIKGQKARVALIGTGSRGRYHIHNLLQIPHAEIIAICDNYEPHLKLAAELCPNARQYKDYRKMLEEKDMVLINFWYTTCTYCVAEFPFMEEAYQMYKDQVGIIAVDQDPVGGQFCKLMEGMLDLLQIFEIIQMILLDIQHHRQGGVEVQEGVTVFAALQHNGVAVAHPVSCVEDRQVAADHDGGIPLSRHEDMGHHGGSGGLTMGTGEADGVFVFTHDHAPGLGTLKNRDTGGSGGLNFGIVIVGGGGADNAVRPLNILGPVADGNMDALGDQLVRGNGGIHIRTGHQQTHTLQHQAQRTHGNAADADQMHMLARLDVLIDDLTAIVHIWKTPFDERFLTFILYNKIRGFTTGILSKYTGKMEQFQVNNS